MKKFYFISGLPRSGSTLLVNILNQNPRFFASSSSGVSELITGIRNTWNSIPEFRASPNDTAQNNVMLGVLNSFYKDVDKEVIFDKSRNWPAYIELMESLSGERVKILATVRDVRDVISSFEKLWRRDSKSVQLQQEKENFVKFQTLKGRVEVWMSANQTIGMPLSRLKDTFSRDVDDRLHFIDFDDLTRKPREVLIAAYEFLGEPYFEHNFDAVDQVTKEDDLTYGFKDLHTIRPKVEPMEPQWPKILGKDYEGYGRLNFWKK